MPDITPLDTSPQQIAHWLMSANLRQIGEVQLALANQGIELHIGTGQLVVEQNQE